MNIERFKQVLAVPTQSMREDQMVAFLQAQAASRPGVTCMVDSYNNVFLKKGCRQISTLCRGAH